MLLSAEFCMSIKGVEIPSGLMTGRINQPIFNPKHDKKKKEMLENAVNKAGLNVTERLALNEVYFPNGGGFDLFPSAPVYTKNIFIKKNTNPDDDMFIQKTKALEYPEHVCRIITKTYRSSKDSLEANLDNAIKKLKRILK
jgi:hypothetical protein